MGTVHKVQYFARLYRSYSVRLDWTYVKRFFIYCELRLSAIDVQHFLSLKFLKGIFFLLTSMWNFRYLPKGFIIKWNYSYQYDRCTDVDNYLGFTYCFSLLSYILYIMSCLLNKCKKWLNFYFDWIDIRSF